MEHFFEKILVLRQKLEKFFFKVGAAVVCHVGFAVLGGHRGRPGDERYFVGFHCFHSFGVPQLPGRGYRKSAGVLLSPALRWFVGLSMNFLLSERGEVLLYGGLDSVAVGLALYRGHDLALTLPMSFGPLAPSSPAIFATSAAISSSDICAG